MFPVQISLRNIPDSPTLETHIRNKTQKISKFCHNIINCHIIIDFSQKHKHQGKLYSARIDLTVPGEEIVITNKLNEDIYVVIRDAFLALIRKLKVYSQKKRGSVKNHQTTLHGHICRLINNEGYGFIEGNDGNEYYFSITNIAYPSFDKILIGDSVEFIGVQLNDGVHAHHITKLKNNRNAA